MAGKKRRSNKVRQDSFKRYEANRTAEKNKARRKKNAEKRMFMIEGSKTEREMLLTDVMTKYKIPSKYAVKRIIGTINESRVRALHDGTIVDKDWFKSRKCTAVVKSIIAKTSLPVEIAAAMAS